MQLGFKATTFEIAAIEFSVSAKYYIQAADTFLEDDEKRPSFLKVALEAYWFQGRSLKDVLPLIARIREAIPKMMLIWKTCASSKERDFTLKQALSFGEKCEQAVYGGRLTLSDIVKPMSIVSRSFEFDILLTVEIYHSRKKQINGQPTPSTSS